MGIAVYWIVNLVDRQIKIYSDPTGPVSTEPEPAAYRRREVFGPGDSIAVVIAGSEARRVSVVDLFP